MRCSEDGVSADVGEDGKRARGNHGAADSQPVESIGEVHGIAGKDNYEANEHHERQERDRPQVGVVQEGLDDEIRVEGFRKRNNQLRGIHPTRLHGDQRYGDEKSREKLQAEFGPCRQAEVAFVDYLLIVVGETDGGISDGREHRDPDKTVAEVGPKQRGDNGGNRNEQPTHGRRSGFLMMRLRSFFPDELPDLELLQAADDNRPNHESGEERGQAGEGGAER
jgi:hypothetical protein